MKTIAVCLAALLCGCSITGHLERRQYRADVLHVSREQYEREQQTYQPPALKIERDSNRFYLVPTEVQENGERIMAMQIQEVTIRATTRTLPERLGKVTIDFVIDMPRQLQGTCRSIAVIPYLHKYGEAHPLQDITIRGGLFSRVQDRDYWQYNKYLHVFNPSEIGAERAFARFVKYPYSEGSRLDSIVQHPGHISYYYSQEVPTDETSKTMLVTLQGWVMALDESYYKLPPSDTLTYHVSSMLSFADTTTRYKIKIIEKYATVQDRNYIQFRLNDTHVLDSLGRNAAELDKIRTRMAGLIGQREFFVDSIVLTASASPEGRYARNSTLAQGRAHALKGYLRKCIGPQVDTLMQIRWIAEDWHELTTRIRSDETCDADVVIGGMFAADGDTYHDILQPYTAACDAEQLYHDPAGYYTFYDVQLMCLVVNPELRDELGIEINSYADLLNPALNGKVIISDRTLPPPAGVSFRPSLPPWATSSTMTRAGTTSSSCSPPASPPLPPRTSTTSSSTANMLSACPTSPVLSPRSRTARRLIASTWKRATRLRLAALPSPRTLRTWSLRRR